MTELQCSFCGKQENRIQRLIAGPGVYICNECVELCQEILDEARGAEPDGARPDDVSPAAEVDERGTKILERDDLPQALEQLSYRERRVLELLYGLSGEQPRTLDEVGTTFKLTRVEIRQIENQSLTKLQSSAGRAPS